MNTNDVSSLSLEESTDELVRLLDGTEENQDPPMDDAAILQQIQDQRSQILKLKETHFRCGAKRQQKLEIFCVLNLNRVVMNS